MSPLHHAAKAGDVRRIQALLDEGADVNVKLKCGKTALDRASKYGRTACVKALLDGGADISVKKADGSTALHTAASMPGNFDVVLALLQAGADVTAKDNKGRTPLQRSSRSPTSERLLKAATALSVEPQERYTISLELSATGNELQEKGEFEQAAAFYSQASHYLSDDWSSASQSLRLSCQGHLASCFLQLGCWQDCTDACSAVLIGNPGSSEAYFWRGQALGKLGQHADAVSNLERALQLSPEAEEAGIRAKLVEVEQQGLATLLHLAAETGDLKRIRVLLDSGALAHINDKNKEGLTPLQQASWSGYIGCMGVLLSKGASISSRARDGSSALHWAALNGGVKPVQLLLEREADVHARSNNERTPLHWAFESGRPECLSLLLDSGADVNAKDAEGRTPLLMGSWNQAACIQVLLERGADVNASGKDGLSRLHWAAGDGDLNTLRVLLGFDADIYAKDSGGRTPLQRARLEGHSDCAEILEIAELKVLKELQTKRRMDELRRQEELRRQTPAKMQKEMQDAALEPVLGPSLSSAASGGLRQLERKWLESGGAESGRLQSGRLEREFEREQLERALLEMALLEHVRLEAERPERARLEMARLEQERLEAERRATGRLEWERKEPARKEQARQEELQKLEEGRPRRQQQPARSSFAAHPGPGYAQSLCCSTSLETEFSGEEPHERTGSELDPGDSGFSEEDPLLSKIKCAIEAALAPPQPLRRPAAQSQPLSPPAIQAPPDGGDGGSGGRADRAVEVDYRHLQMQKLLGEGSYGKVYAAKYRGGRLAVKVLVKIRDIDFLPDPNCPLLARLRQEAEKMAVLRHENVVRLKAICVRPPCLLTEYAPNHSVADLLAAGAQQQADKVAVLTWKRRVGMALDVAKGMAYLHGLDPPMVHANLKSANLLIDRGWRVKVADTNVQHLVDVDGSVTSAMMMNPQYLAPEQLDGSSGGAVPASDVYAFGVILWELLTWQKPWANENAWSIVQKVTGGGSLPIPPAHELPGPDKPSSAELEAYKRLMVQCWDKSYLERPTFLDVITELEKVGPASKDEIQLVDPLLASPPAPASPARSEHGEVADAHLDMWVIDYATIKLEEELGRGAYGMVFRGHWNETEVAVKRLDDLLPPGVANPRARQAQLDALRKEAGLLAAMRHPHIVGFMGLCTSPPAIITELCARGSLLDVLRSAQRDPASLPWSLRLRMAREAALGMNYLHCRSPAIIHRDLKSPNLLVDADNRIKVADFGLSRRHDTTSRGDTMDNINPRWAAPEVLDGGSAKASPASDVYALGMVMWELMALDIPWPRESSARVSCQVMMMKARPKVPAEPPGGGFDGLQAYVALMERCWAQDPSERPDSFAAVLEGLRAIPCSS